MSNRHTCVPESSTKVVLQSARHLCTNVSFQFAAQQLELANASLSVLSAVLNKHVLSAFSLKPRRICSQACLPTCIWTTSLLWHGANMKALRLASSFGRWCCNAG
eukprot:3433795-Amphidinium_carterae.1